MKSKLVRIVVGVLFLCGAVSAQDAETDESDPTTTEGIETEDAADESTDAVTDEEVDEEIDEEGLDVQGFEPEDDDDFVPTEDIPADQSIPFPTDI